MKQQVAKTIKVVSTIAIAGALGLVGWDLWLHSQGKSLATNLSPLFSLATVALIAHAVEGVIAAFKVRTSDKNPILYGIYTFFVGFVGLQELSQD